MSGKIYSREEINVDNFKSLLNYMDKEDNSNLSITLYTSESKKKSTSNKKPKKNRCFICNKKIGLLGNTCDCGNQYCSKHKIMSLKIIIAILIIRKRVGKS